MRRTSIRAALALAGVLPATAAAAEPPQWLDGPWVLDASAARNPDVDARGGQIHVVYRVRSGGIGHITRYSVDTPTPELVIPGSVATAAVTRSWNFPRVAVDAGGAGHVVWGPLSTEPLKGTWYASVDANGGLAIEATQVTDRWVEDVDVAVVGDQVHVLINAIGAAPGVFDWSGSVATGPTAEQQVWASAVMRELALHAHDGGLAAIGRFTKVERADLELGQGWSTVQHLDGPGAPYTSIGFPRMVLGNEEIWAAMGWIDATPTAAVVRNGGSWATLSVDPPFDPIDADGGSPAVSLARDAQGRVAVAWLAESGDRLRMALADPQWGDPVSLPQTSDATSFDLCADGEGFWVVYATDDGVLHDGRFGVPADPPPEETTGDDGGLDGTAGSSDDASSATEAGTGTTATTTVTAGDGGIGLDPGGSSSEPGTGCGCSGGPDRDLGGMVLGWVGLLLVGLRCPRKQQGRQR